MPCVASSLCDYRFFIDKSEQAVDSSVKSESDQHNDIIFRNDCELMKRHPDYINYGNSPPRNENFRIKYNGTEIDSPDYKWRRMYKIDWKVCFMQYARDHHKMAEYHAFVEDDSYTCTENLLYQASILHKKSVLSGARHSFRTGTAMFDGFDDSSTFMTRDVALAFANHYDTTLNCSRVVDYPNSSAWEEGIWQSWGNSWMKKRCGWMHQLHAQLHMPVLKPTIDCMAATALNVSKGLTKLEFPCTDHTIIMHHGTAGETLLRGKPAHVAHTCEYMLLIDKVKDPTVMRALWNATASSASFHDFSEVFLHDGDIGWLATLHTLAEEEAKCRIEHPDIVSEQSKDCIFETRRRLQQLQEVHLALFGATLSGHASTSAVLSEFFFRRSKK